MKRIAVDELNTGNCAAQIEERLKEKRISFQIAKEEGWVQIDACGPCAERLEKENKPIEGCEKCVAMAMEIVKELGYTGKEI